MDEPMNHDQEFLDEPRQHEIDKRLHWFELNRRSFLQVLGGGLLVCIAGAHAIAQESGRGNRGHELPKELDAWLHIGQDGNITAFTGKVEMGQNIRTSLAQQIAEELHIPIDTVSLVMGDTDRVPWDAGTFGSRTTPTMAPQLRSAASTAREMLVQLAAKQLNADVAELTLANGKVVHARTNRSIGFGELTHGQQLVRTVASEVPAQSPTDWQITGKPWKKVNAREIVTGKHQYPSDIVRPEMLHGKVLRPKGFKAKLKSLDTKDAEKISGAKIVRDGEFVGVVAPSASVAMKAVEAIKAEWDIPQQPSNQNLFDYLMHNLDSTQMSSEHVLGSVEQAMPTAEVKLNHNYTVQYIAHAPLEPRAAVAEWNGDKLTVWTGTQRPFGVRDELVDALRIDPSKVRILVPDTGSAYGGKHSGDAAVEAARLAKAAGKPVRVVWTREEEFTWAYFRPAGVMMVKSGVQRDGTLTAWEFHNYNSGPSGIRTPYAVANQLIQYHPADSPLRQGSYRGLAATANHFARESHMDEIAHEIRMDPLQFRLKNLTDERLRAVLIAATKQFGWGTQKSSASRGFGVACGVEKGGYVATCAEVELDAQTKRFRVSRVVEAFDCGRVVNPDGLENQISGAIVQGLGGALFEQVKFANGKILNPHFADYPVPRFAHVPRIEVVLVDRKDLPSAGAGETPIVGLAPAIGNALFSATGMRQRNMPFSG
jgi:CO/xanthine dehydrogenase Mo-binding subunit